MFLVGRLFMVLFQAASQSTKNSPNAAAAGLTALAVDW